MLIFISVKFDTTLVPSLGGAKFSFKHIVVQLSAQSLLKNKKIQIPCMPGHWIAALTLSNLQIEPLNLLLLSPSHIKKWHLKQKKKIISIAWLAIGLQISYLDRVTMDYSYRRLHTSDRVSIKTGLEVSLREL